MAQKIHILGLGNVGKLVANSLAASRSSPPITLLFHSAELAAQWRDTGGCIDVITEGIPRRQCNFNVARLDQEPTEETGPIANLVVATKTHVTTEALRPLRHRLNTDSTIVFLQNGMGTIEEVTGSLFASSTLRPQFVAGIVNHGVYKNGPFSVVHAGQGYLTLGMIRLPDERRVQTGSGSSENLLRCLCEAPSLSASVVPPSQILYLQLEKLSVNAVINPLTAILDCRNGELFNRPPVDTLIQRLLVEIASIIQPMLAGESTGLENQRLVANFSPSKLHNTVSNTAARSAENISSMCQDMRAGRKTEIDYINGYIVSQALETGQDCPINRRLVEMVHRRMRISEDLISEYFSNL